MLDWLAIVPLTFKRLVAQRGLTLATLVGLTVAVALLMTVPLYADAVNFRILQQQLSNQTERNQRPPFAYLYNYVGAWHDPVTWEATVPVGDYLRRDGARTLGLSGQTFVQHIETNDYAALDIESPPLRFGTTTDLQDHIEIVDGSWPDPAPLAHDQPLGVLLTTVRSAESGVNVGDQFTLVDNDDPTRQLTVEVSGLWQPLDPNADYWFYAPASFDRILTVPQASYSGRLANQIENEVHLGVWYWVLDGRRVGTGDVDRLVAGARQVEREIDRLLPNTQALQSPATPLQSYQRAVSILTTQLLGFNAPTLGLVLAFISLVVGLGVQQRRNELAITRSRGGSIAQIVGISALEGLIIGLGALLLGTLVAMWLTGQMGRVRSFLDFSAETNLRILLNRATLRAGVLAVVGAVAAQVIPTLAIADETIIDYKQSQARRSRPPWWQRNWLDVMLFLAALYGFYRVQGGGNPLGQDGVGVFDNPLLLLLPTVGILSVTLFFIRLLPILMNFLSYLVSLTNSVPLLLATRSLARSTGLYATPLVLLTLTVSLSVFTASLARTFDLQLYDQWFYRTGADINLLTTPDTSAQNRFNPRPVAASSSQYLPPSAYEAIDGVENGARVGIYPANVIVGGSRSVVEFIGVERLDFAQVAYWRGDFSDYRFGSLLNGLGRSAESVLVANQFLTATGLEVGDSMLLTVSVVGGRVSFSADIVGSFDYFPTWDPSEDDPLIVGNLGTIFEKAGGEVPFRVWLTTNETFDEAVFDDYVQTELAGITLWREPASQIESTLVQPQRQGVFGLLSVGFIASALLTVLGFFLYAIFSFRRRMIELGILRASGLSLGSMMRFVAWELGLLITSGLLLGTALGVWISQQFIPLLQTGTRQADLVPPYLVEIAWPAIIQIYVLLGLLFLAAFAALSLLLQRMKLFEVVKLGETV